MTDYEGQTFTNEQIHLDGNSYTNCYFENCNLIYSGGELPNLVGNELVQTTMSFGESASRTIQFMRAIYHGFGETGRELIDNTFEQIMRSSPAEPS